MTIFFKGFTQISSLFLVFWLSLVPITGQAWFFSWPQAEAQAESVPSRLATENTQNISLLASVVAMTSDLKPDNGANITISDDAALEPEIGAAGTLADVTDGPGDALVVYTVVPADSVASIAKRFGVSENTVRWANNLKAGQPIHVGDTLVILPMDGLQYKVKSGDTIASLIKKYKLTSQEQADFLDYNGLTESSAISAGDDLVIPGAEPVAVSTVATPKKAIPRGNVRVNVGAYTPAVSASGIIRDYFIKPVRAAACRYSQYQHDTYAVDIACPTGTPIRAAADGTVIFAKYGINGGYGNLIIMKHGNETTTFYAHLKAEGILVSQGQSVSQGTVIGYVGSTGRSTGPHLHFEVRGKYKNPGFDRTDTAWKAQ